MPASEIRSTILAFAAHIGRGHIQPPEAVAKRRNWLSDDGDVTPDGHALVEALTEQSATRTVFRGNF